MYHLVQLILQADQLQEILDVLKKVKYSTAHWRELGGRLKPDLDLDAIEADYSGKRRLEKVITRWLCDGEEPSWEKLADAVSKCEESGGKNVAQKIRELVGLGEVEFFF